MRSSCVVVIYCSVYKVVPKYTQSINIAIVTSGHLSNKQNGTRCRDGAKIMFWFVPTITGCFLGIPLLRHMFHL